MNKTYLLAACIVAVHTVFASPNITVDSVVQRWPFHGGVVIRADDLCRGAGGGERQVSAGKAEG